jgi:glycosyltransferase involved in cell wall biosynthesis
VVDNGSRDETPALAQRAAVVDRVVRRARGEGPGAARNAGAHASTGEVVAFTDADCRPAPGWLAAGSRAARGADIVQGRVLPDPAVRQGPFDRTLVVDRAYGLFETANLFVRRELIDRIGGFPHGLERAGPPFGEDVLFAWRARRAGATTGFCPEALVYHEVTPRSARAYVAERHRLSLFCELARQVPELRDVFFYRRVFHSPQSAAFDLALAAALVAAATRRPAAMLGAVPYLRLLSRRTRPWGRRVEARVAAAELAADALGAAALLAGSLRARTLLL